jgi:hypothetical protein
MITKRMAAPLVAAMMLALPAGLSLAQTPPAPPPAAHQPPSPETMARLLDGRIAMLKAALRLNDAQAKLFQPVEDMIRANAADRAKHREEWAKKRAESGAAATKTSLPERIEKMSEHMAKRAEKMKKFAAVLKPLYDSFSDEQKAVAGPLLAMMGGHHHHGHGGPGGHHGFGHHGMGPDTPPAEGAPK